MHYRSLLVLTLALWSTASLSLPRVARAEIPLNKAIVQDLRNQVRLLLKNQPPRPAKRLDILIPGDALATARTAGAELTFNDKSLARLGEQALFRFLPNTRSFRLDNGTLLLLIPPGQGTTRVRTPNAAAGIRGSALFVRYNPETTTTLVGALTNSQIEVSNQDNSQSQTLKAGQMAVIIQGRIERVYDFDLNTFYETSELAKGLDLPRRNAAANPDAAIAAVQAETAEAIRTQVPLVGQGIVDNPAFVRLGQTVSVATPALQNDLDRTVPYSLSPLTGVFGEARRVYGKQTPGEPGMQIVVGSVALPPMPSPSQPLPGPTLLTAPIVGSPAPLPGSPAPNPPELPSLPSLALPTAPITGSPAPLPEPTAVQGSGGTVLATPQPSTPPLAAPAPLPPTPAITATPVLQPPTVSVVQPAPVPPTPTVTVTPYTPPAVVQPAPALPAPPIVAPAPTPPTAVIVQPAASQAISAPVRVIEVAPAAIAPVAPTVLTAPAPAPTPPVNSVPVTPPGTDSPPIVPTSNPAIQTPQAPAGAGVTLEITPSSAKVTPLLVK